MEEYISFCGDLCSVCPRKLAKSEEDKQRIALLWYKVEWRDKIVSAEEIPCAGCHSRKPCSYGLVECAFAHGVEKCSQCKEFPCTKIEAVLEKSRMYEKRCREVCTPEEYEALRISFFQKEANLIK